MKKGGQNDLMTWAQSVKARDNYKCVACGAIEHFRGTPHCGDTY